MNIVEAQAKKQVRQMSHDIRKDIKEWRYKVIDKKVYKRLFNVTKNRWETDWILVRKTVIIQVTSVVLFNICLLYIYIPLYIKAQSRNTR